MKPMRLSRFLVALAAAATLTAGCGDAPAVNPPPASPPPAPSAGIPPPPDVAAPPANATKTASGISWLIVKPGTGTIHPKPTSTVKVHYTGWKTNGESFDSSTLRGQPIEFRLDGVIKGWTEGVQLMVLGEKRRFWIPGALAYDLIPDPTAPKGMLVFDIELLDIK
jgi:FKBP-type peptidyl-prolyl cis-trans isomerase